MHRSKRARVAGEEEEQVEWQPESLEHHVQQLARASAAWQVEFNAGRMDVDESMLLYDVRGPSGKMYYAQAAQVVEARQDVKWAYGTETSEEQASQMRALVTGHKSNFAFGMHDLGHGTLRTRCG